MEKRELKAITDICVRQWFRQRNKGPDAKKQIQFTIFYLFSNEFKRSLWEGLEKMGMQRVIIVDDSEMGVTLITLQWECSHTLLRPKSENDQHKYS